MDPTVAGVGVNRYAYAFNNPVMMLDPSGLGEGWDHDPRNPSGNHGDPAHSNGGGGLSGGGNNDGPFSYCPNCASQSMAFKYNGTYIVNKQYADKFLALAKAGDLNAAWTGVADSIEAALRALAEDPRANQLAVAGACPCAMGDPNLSTLDMLVIGGAIAAAPVVVVAGVEGLVALGIIEAGTAIAATGTATAVTATTATTTTTAAVTTVLDGQIIAGYAVMGSQTITGTSVTVSIGVLVRQGPTAILGGFRSFVNALESQAITAGGTTLAVNANMIRNAELLGKFTRAFEALGYRVNQTSEHAIRAVKDLIQ